MVGSEDIHRRIVESSHDGMWLVDLRGRTLYANPRVAELLGRTEEEIAALAFPDVLDADDRRCYEAHLRDLAHADPDRRSVERVFRRPDGSPVPLIVKEQAMHDDEGRLVGYLHRLTDDTRRRVLVDELSRNRSQLAEAQAIARIGSWEIQLDPYEVSWSDQLYEILGVDPATYVAGLDEFLEHVLDGDRDVITDGWAEIGADPVERGADVRIRRADGEVRWVRAVGKVLEWGPAGEPLRFGGTVQDIHHLKQAELQLLDVVELNTMMQAMATAANESSSLDEALGRLRQLLLADDDWARGVAFTVVADDLVWRPLPPHDGERPDPAERVVAERVLAGNATVFDEHTVPDRPVIGFPVSAGDSIRAVVVVTGAGPLREREMVESLVAQVASQLAHVAEREALLDELTRSRSKLAEAQAIAHVGSWEFDARTGAIAWSEELFDLLGIDQDGEPIGPEAYIARAVEEDQELIRERWLALPGASGELTTDARIRAADGSVRWMRTVGRVLERSPDGTPLTYGGTVQDIDDLKQAELKLRDAVELNTLMHFVATAANETSTLDEVLARTRELLLAHHDWQRAVAFDVTESGLASRAVSPEDEVHPTDLEWQLARRVLAEGALLFEEEAVRQHPMIGFPVLRQGTPQVIGVITAKSPFERHEMLRSLVDQVAAQLSQVADREAAAAELAAARDLAMAASQAKSEFLATMSHEIRTPLNGVIGLNDLLLRTELDPHQRQLAESMQGAGRALLVLISDILDFSKIEAGGLELEDVAFQPAVVVQGALELFGPMADAKGIALEVDLDRDVPERLEGDPSRFGQVLSNLVANAVKFTHEGGVHVRVSCTTVGSTATLHVVVRDTGIGMDAEQVGRIFQPFRQADASTTRTFGGTGLGLAIAHRLAAALGGQIGVTSTPGEGSSFWFTGRFQVPRGGSRPVVRDASPVAQPRPGGHVLVVEDNEVNQLVAVGMLRVLGYTSEVAADGAAAAARAAGGAFDAVLMDLQMPRLDGYAATRLIRRAEAPGVRLPIIALTASATSGEQERCLAAGMTGFLSKPVALEALGRVLAEQIGGAPGVVAGPSTAAVTTTQAGSDGGAVAPTLDPGRLEELAEMGQAAVPLIQRAIDNFVDAIGENLAGLRADLRRRDAAALRADAHRLKGSAANLGALRVAELAREIERLAEDDQLVTAAQVLDDLAAALAEAAAELDGYQLDPDVLGEAYSA